MDVLDNIKILMKWNLILIDEKKRFPWNPVIQSNCIALSRVTVKHVTRMNHLQALKGLVVFNARLCIYHYWGSESTSTIHNADEELTYAAKFCSLKLLVFLSKKS